MRKQKQCRCAICEETIHNKTDYYLNAKNHRAIHKTKFIPNDQGQSTNFRHNGYNQREGYNGRGRYNNQGGYNNQVGTKIILEEDLDVGYAIKTTILV